MPADPEERPLHGERNDSTGVFKQVVEDALIECGGQGGGDAGSDPRATLTPTRFEGSGSRQRWRQPLSTTQSALKGGECLAFAQNSDLGVVAQQNYEVTYHC